MSRVECPSCGLALRTIEEMEAGRCSVCSPLQIREERPEPFIKKPGRLAWRIPVNEQTEFCVKQYDDGFIAGFTGTEGDVVMDRGGLRAMRSLIDMVDLVLGEER